MAARTSSLRAYVLTRIVLMGPMILILLSMVFYLLRLAPGDPVSAILGERNVIYGDAIRRELGLYDPIEVQYVRYLYRVFTGDMGTSIYTQRSVSSDIAQRLPATFELALSSMVIAIFVGVGLGVVSATHRDRPLDIVSRLTSAVMYNTPVFWLGLMMQVVFGLWLGWFDVGGRLNARTPIPDPNLPFDPSFKTGLYTIDSLLAGQPFTFADAIAHLILPSLTLGLVLSGFFARMVRANMLQTLQADYVEAATARGVPRRQVFYGHALKNAMVPVSTTMGLTFAALFSGAILTETVFSWEGMGRYIYYAIAQRDYPALQGAVVYYALIMVVISLFIDIFNAWLDPRIRY